MKRLLKQVIPPFLWDMARRKLTAAPVRVTYEGRFESFEEVARKYHDFTSYHSSVSEEAELEEGRKRLGRFESGKAPEDTVTLPRLNFLPTLLSAYPGEKTAILDVGGGLGISFLDLKFSLPQRDFTMTVLELPSMIQRGSDLFENYPEIDFSSSLSDEGRGIDVVHFGSSLQYFEDYQGILKRVADLHPDLIVISDTTMGDADSFVAAQVNMAERVIPRMVFNRKELEGICADQGYDLVHRSVNYSQGLSFSNYDAPVSETRHWNLVFQRILE